MNIYAPSRIELLSESSEGNCAQHYAYLRACASAYWGAINYARRLIKEYDLVDILAQPLSWQLYSEEVDEIPSCH